MSTGQPIVVIGRRKSGKTVFLARLYEALWKGAELKDGLLDRAGPSDGGRRRVPMSCRAEDGPTHMALMRMIDELHQGRFPAATVGQSEIRLVVSLRKREHPVVTIDYPGELFQNAFLGGSQDDEARHFRGFIESAAGAILLIDPDTVFSGILERQGDAFGLMDAVIRMRRSVGGESKPIAVVFTKYDLHRAVILEAGGVEAFARKHFPRLVEAIGSEGAAFASSAVHSETNNIGRIAPNVRKPPYNLIQPFHYCLSTIAGADS